MGKWSLSFCSFCTVSNMLYSVSSQKDGCINIPPLIYVLSRQTLCLLGQFGTMLNVFPLLWPLKWKVWSPTGAILCLLVRALAQRLPSGHPGHTVLPPEVGAIKTDHWSCSSHFLLRPLPCHSKNFCCLYSNLTSHHSSVSRLPSWGSFRSHEFSRTLVQEGS